MTHTFKLFLKKMLLSLLWVYGSVHLTEFLTALSIIVKILLILCPIWSWVILMTRRPEHFYVFIGYYISLSCELSVTVIAHFFYFYTYKAPAHFKISLIFTLFHHSFFYFTFSFNLYNSLVNFLSIE